MQNLSTYLRRCDDQRRAILMHFIHELRGVYSPAFLAEIELTVLTQAFPIGLMQKLSRTANNPETWTARERITLCSGIISLLRGRAQWGVYRGKVRSMIFNMANSPEVALRRDSGTLTVAWLTSASPQELWPDRWKNLALPLHLQNEVAEIEYESTQFRCGKCKERKTTYRQMQTRSADEPMTTFVRCTVCGNRWKC